MSPVVVDTIVLHINSSNYNQPTIGRAWVAGLVVKFGVADRGIDSLELHFIPSTDDIEKPATSVGNYSLVSWCRV